MNKTIYLIDIDGTVCEDVPNEEAHRFLTAKPIEGALDMVNKVLEEGNRVTFFTARTSEHANVTEQWLKNNGFPFESVCYNKPRTDDGWEYHWVDNKPVTSTYTPEGFVLLGEGK